MAVVNKFNVNNKQVTLDADIIENMSANDVSYNSSLQYDENTVGNKLAELSAETIKANDVEILLGEAYMPCPTSLKIGMIIKSIGSTSILILRKEDETEYRITTSDLPYTLAFNVVAVAPISNASGSNVVVMNLFDSKFHTLSVDLQNEITNLDKKLSEEITEVESKSGTTKYNYSSNIPFVLDRYFAKEDVIFFSPSQTNVRGVTLGGYIDGGDTEDIVVGVQPGDTKIIKLTKNYTKLYLFSSESGSVNLYLKDSIKGNIKDVENQLQDVEIRLQGVEVEAEKNISSIINIPFYTGDVILYKNIGLYPATIGGYLESGGTEDIVKYLPAGESKSIKLTKNYTKLYGFSSVGAYKIAVVKYSDVEKYIETQIESSTSVNAFDNTILNIGLSPFLKFASVGDSLSVGEWQEDGGSFVNRRDLQNSWGQILARKYGNKCLNFGFAGATCKSFYDSESHGISELLLSENLCQAYIIGLGTNDTSDIGSIDDINWNDKSLNTDSFYGNYAKIIQAIKEYAPKSLLFCLTIPFPRNSQSKNTAIRNIIETCDIEGVYLVDLDTEKYRKVYSSSEVTGFYHNGHFNAGGYAVCGNILDIAIGEVILEHNTDSAIRNISGIPYGNGEMVE